MRSSEPGIAKKVFLSCSGRDVHFVREIGGSLAPYFSSVEVSSSSNDHSPAKDLDQAIQEDFRATVDPRITTCDVFVLFFGEVVDEQQLREMTHAVHSDLQSGIKRIYLVCLLDGHSLPPSLEHQDFVQLRNCQRLTARSAFDEAKRVAVEIKKYIEMGVTSGEEHEMLEDVPADGAMRASSADRGDHAMRGSGDDRAMYNASDKAMRVVFGPDFPRITISRETIPIPPSPKKIREIEELSVASSTVDQEKTPFEKTSPTEVFPHANIDKVNFSITSPTVLLPGSSHMIDVWAHLSKQLEEVLSLAKLEARSDSIAIRSEGQFEITRGTILTVQLSIQDLEVEPSEKCIIWHGGIGKAGFFVSVPKGLTGGARKGVGAIRIDGIPLVKVFFVVEIGGGATEPRNLPVETRRYRTAFISYASRDKDAVLARVQGLKKGVPNLDVFWPPADIQSGARWRDVLAQEILSRDVLYLFWSVAASQSQWVDWEWRFAFTSSFGVVLTFRN